MTDTSSSDDSIEASTQQTLLEYQAILENASVGIMFTRDRRVLHCNPSFSEIFGWPHGELVGQSGAVFYLSPDDYAEMGRTATPILSSAGLLDIEMLMRRKDGSTVYCRARAKAINPHNTAEGTIWIVEDIEERQRAQAELQELLHRQQAILENASIGILFTCDAQVAHCNPRLESMMGWAPGTLFGQRTEVFFKDDQDYARFGQAVGPKLAAGVLVDIEWHYAHRDGSLIPCRYLAKALPSTDGSRSTIWIMEDISEKKAAQLALATAHQELEQRVRERTDELAQANARLMLEVAERKELEHHLVHSEAQAREMSASLRDSEMMSRAITEGMAEGVMTTTTDDIVLEANAAALRLFGYEKSELIGRDASELVPERHRRQYKDTTAAQVAQPEAFRIPGRELRCVRKDGSEFSASISFADVQVGGRRLFTAVIQDITERKRAREEILRLNANLEERVLQRTEELQSQQEELRQSNQELEEKNKLLADQRVEVIYKNREIEAAKLTLEERAEQLALTSKYKSEFLSNMSHELRTPLNSLLILAQLLAENAEHNLSGQQIEYAKTIQGAGKDLLALINDILDLAKIESGTVTLDLQDVLFANVHKQVKRTFRHVAQSRGLDLVVELAPSLPPSLYTDSQRLQQVLKNLLSNAFKFTERGRVSVRIAAVESGWSVAHAGLNRAEAVIGFFVTDSGIGVATTKQKIIFDSFQQADTGTARKYGGTGLGLSISREIAWLLGGELRLEMSEPGQGSTFVLYLPLRAPEHVQNRRGTPRGAPGREFLGSDTKNSDPAAKAAARVSMSQETNSGPSAVADDRAAIKPGKRTLLIIEDDARFADILSAGILSADILAGKKVLVVDDDVRNIFALTAVLERHNMAVLSAENGSKALEELGQNPDLDIVLMDMMMPEMDGFETMRQIRKMKQFESMPIIALTAKAMKGDREKCIAAGASDYLSKPVDTDQLVSLLRVWLYR